MVRRSYTVAILTYHSISNEPGPTSIPPGVFADQMRALSQADVDVFSLAEVEEWLNGRRPVNRRTVAITFDDAFRDFAEAAHPVLEEYGFPSTVFVPTMAIGGHENWIGANDNVRPLMSWDEIRALRKKGVSFGSHTQFHSDLTMLEEGELEEALSGSRKDLEEALGEPITHFAPPYGRSNKAVRSAIARHYSLSVGVNLGEASRSSPINDLPRIEMHYYRDVARWSAYLGGRGEVYLKARQAARMIKKSAAGVLRAIHQ